MDCQDLLEAYHLLSQRQETSDMTRFIQLQLAHSLTHSLFNLLLRLVYTHDLFSTSRTLAALAMS